MNDKIVENLLNVMYKEPDLKIDIFNFIQPYITKAYTLLQRDKINRESGEQTLFSNVEQNT